MESSTKHTDAEMSSRKFGKQIQRRQLDLPEYAASFVNYKALKKVWKFSINLKNFYMELWRNGFHVF